MTTPFDRWSRLHHGIDPAGVPLLRGWLRLLWTLAGPAARLGVAPTAVTVLGVLLAGAAVLTTAAVPVAALLLVVAAAVCDGLDGAVAVLAERATPAGARADAVADRLVDALFAAVLWRCGVPAWLAVIAAVTAVGVDLLRRARHVPTVITVGERPTWTVCAALACLCAALSDARWPVLICAAVWLAAGAVAAGQLLRAHPPPVA